MAHWSEDAKRLSLINMKINRVSELTKIEHDTPAIYLFWLPAGRSNNDAINSKSIFDKLAQYCTRLHKESTVCILTTPADAALILPHLQEVLKFQHWIAIKTIADSYTRLERELPNRHAALLILTRYTKYLRHTKTRIQYTYCPICEKTTKDYGGKKHTYHEYGTLLSDVWRDIECNPRENIDTVVDRLQDLFGLNPYKDCYLMDMRLCKGLLPIKHTESATSPAIMKRRLPNVSLPVNQLINGDCLSVLRSLPADSVDFCFADLPYNLSKKYYRSNDSLESDKYFEWCNKWLSELCRVLKPGCTLAVLNIPQWSVRHYQYLCSFMKFQEWIVWEALSLPARNIMPSHYSIICFTKGTPRPLPGLSSNNGSPDNEYLRALGESYCIRPTCKSRRRKLAISDHVPLNNLWNDIHRLKHNSRRTNHPCQLPPLLMRRLFALFTKPGDIILDCFNGAGTSTLVACQMGRQFIGIELSARYHRLALRRHELLTRGEDPFGKLDTIPKAKNSRVRRLPKKKYKITKRALQLDVKRIAVELGRLPTRKEVKTLSKFHIKYFREYFVSWSEVYAAARTTGMSETPTRTNLIMRSEEILNATEI